MTGNSAPAPLLLCNHLERLRYLCVHFLHVKWDPSNSVTCSTKGEKTHRPQKCSIGNIYNIYIYGCPTLCHFNFVILFKTTLYVSGVPCPSSGDLILPGKQKCGRTVWYLLVSLVWSVLPWHCLSIDTSRDFVYVNRGIVVKVVRYIFWSFCD
jgi:hypothetical protein